MSDIFSKMSQITKKLLYLDDTKEAIKAKLLEKGVAVSESDTFRSYAEKIDEIKGGAGSGDAVVWYVTFIGADGSELFKMPVLDGDDCKDPKAHGDISTPTKESDAGYTYTFSGWATTAGGSANSAALQSVKEDKTVYAAFTGAVKYYTITYYDADGVTILKTETLAYGTVGTTYEPTKTGYYFNGWVPAFAPVTGDASYVVNWAETLTFSNGSWEDIIAAVNEGKAKEYFAVGDTRKQTIVHSDGTSEIVTLTVADFDKDTKTDGSKAAMTIISNVLASSQPMATSDYKVHLFNETSMYTSYLRDIRNNLPSVLQGALKKVSKSCSKAYNYTETLTADLDVWLLNRGEAGNASGYQCFRNNTATYDIGHRENGSAATYWLRDGVKNTTTGRYYAVTTGGELYNTYNWGTKLGVRFGFCI